MSHTHRKPITAAEFRQSVKIVDGGESIVDDGSAEAFAWMIVDHAEQIALALELMEERANSEVM